MISERIGNTVIGQEKGNSINNRYGQSSYLSRKSFKSGQLEKA